MKMMMVGLGLIGGSMALALCGEPELELYAVDCDERTRCEAILRGAVRDCWESASLAPIEEMDVVVLCLHPQACARFVCEHAKRLSPGALLTDVCGVKHPLHEAVAALGPTPFDYLGGHPMAGRERGGFANARADLFRGAHYILTPDAHTPPERVAFMKKLALTMGCRDVVLTTSEAHDERIAYTSQLMHVLALALCDQHLLFDSYGFEGSSFAGATRVAALDPRLWCELFWANRQTLPALVDELIERLGEYSALLRGEDPEALLARLTASSERKKAFDRLRSGDGEAL